MNPVDYHLFLLLGGIIVLSIFIRALFRKTAIPALIIFLIVGLLLSYSRSLEYFSDYLSQDNLAILHFMGTLGLFTLLFRAGLESHPAKLTGQLGPASFVWFGNFFLSGLAGFAAGYWWLDLDLIGSLVVGAALTATSIAVSVAIWEDKDMMERDEASLMLDVAEMDDISGVVLLSLLITLIPLMQNGGDAQQLLGSGIEVVAWFMFKLVLFGGVCLAFAHYVEDGLTGFFEKITPGVPHVMLVVVGAGVIVAGVAEFLGFSLAIGALFAGLIFSRDTKEEQIDKVFEPMYLLLSPFFFIGIGLSIKPDYMFMGLSAGLVLVVAAFIGKIVGGGIPARKLFGWTGATAIGVSLVPRAEITLLIAERAHALGNNILSAETLAAIVFVSVVTCILSPLVVSKTIRKLEN